MLYFIITFFTGVITGALIEAAARKAFEAKKPKEPQTNPAFVDDPPIVITSHKLKQCTLQTAISKERFADHPSAAIELVEKRLGRQFGEYLSDQFMSNQISRYTDYTNNCYIFEVSFWIREAEI